MNSVFQMVNTVLANSKEKLAMEAEPQGNGEGPKETAEKCEKCGKDKSECDCSEEKTASMDAEKVAAACDYLADNLGLLVDDRSPKEKLAEYVAIHDELTKMAIGDEPQGPHQTAKANSDSISPMNPGVTNADQMGAGANQVDSGPNMASGSGIEAGGGGSATAEKVIDKSIQPNEKAFPADVSNALETNQDTAPGGSAEMIQKVASERAKGLARLMAQGSITKEAAATIIQQDRMKIAALEGATVDPRWVASQQAMQVAGQRPDARMDALGRPMPDPELAQNALVQGLAGGAIGGLGGAAVGGALGGGRGALTGAGIGGLGGLMTGSGRAWLDDMRSKGVDPQYLGLGGAKLTPEAASKYLSSEKVDPAAGKVEALKQKAASAGVPVKLASALIAKLAEDSINPASVGASTTPVLQNVPEANPAQMQGSASGEQVPPTKGADSGRQGIQSNVAAINAKKNDLKGKRTRSEMGKYLDEPALSSAHDSVLQKSLDNTSSAGVKIAATRALLQKWAAQSPDNQATLAQAMTKVSAMGDAGQPPMAPPAQAAPGTPAPGAGPAGLAGAMPGMGMGKGAMGEEGIEPVSDAALAAAAQGVTPEEVAEAEELLAAQMGAGGQVTGAEPPMAEGPPPAGPPPAAPPAGPPAGAPPAGGPPPTGM